MIPLVSDATLMEKLFAVTLQWMVTMKVKMNVTTGLWMGILQIYRRWLFEMMMMACKKDL